MKNIPNIVADEHSPSAVGVQSPAVPNPVFLDYSREQLDKAYDQSLWAPQMDAAIIEAGLDFDLTKTATLGLSYSGQLVSNAQDHGFKADLAVMF